MNIDEIKKLADLSRLKISDQDLASYKKDFDGIIKYIDTIQSISIQDHQDQDFHNQPQVNALREDTTHYAPGEFTRLLVDAAPHKEGDYIKVAKVL